jgi:hypothetical protein
MFQDAGDAAIGEQEFFSSIVSHIKPSDTDE